MMVLPDYGNIVLAWTALKFPRDFCMRHCVSSKLLPETYAGRYLYTEETFLHSLSRVFVPFWLKTKKRSDN